MPNSKMKTIEHPDDLVEGCIYRFSALDFEGYIHNIRAKFLGLVSRKDGEHIRRLCIRVNISGRRDIIPWSCTHTWVAETAGE